MSDLAVLVPVLGRPHRVKPLLDSLFAATPGTPRVLFVCDPSDRAERDAIKADGRGGFITIDGAYAKKINAALALTGEPLVFIGADDLTFHGGWLQAAKEKLTNGIGVVGTQDLCNKRTIRGEHSTHFLVTRAYADRGQVDGEPGLLCERYEHNFVDDELIATATSRGAYAFASEAIVEHHHPLAGTAPMDPTYQKAIGALRGDRRIYRSRRPLWET